MSEIEKKIDECIEELSYYKHLSPEVEEAIRGFERLKERLRNLTRENIDDILRIVELSYQRSQAYSHFIPKTVANLKYIKEWLERKREELS